MSTTHQDPTPASNNTSNNNNENDAYIDHSTNDLTLWPGAALIVADCMGTGILALPNNMKVLGFSGFVFLVLNLPINFYAGGILHQAASSVEVRLDQKLNSEESGDDNGVEFGLMANQDETIRRADSDTQGGADVDDQYGSIQEGMELPSRGGPRINSHAASNQLQLREDWDYDDGNESGNENEIRQSRVKTPLTPDQGHKDIHPQGGGIATPHTFDLVGITYAIFDHFRDEYDDEEIVSNSNYASAPTTMSTPTPLPERLSKTTRIVAIVYFTNIFLVLGNYILVMSHAVAAMVGEENICLPTAGIIASTLMFAISQLRTMAMLGRSVSVISLLSLAIVVIQCLAAIQSGQDSFSYNNNDENQRRTEEVNVSYYSIPFWQSIVSQLAALSSIGFAVGSQKLLLNIRHEFKDRNESPKSLGIALCGFGLVYVLVCVLAGPNPPSLLFDAVQSGTQRRIAGFLLWVHVAVSYAINSQALCSSMERMGFQSIANFGLATRHRLRWAVLTLIVATSSYFVANAVPFFKDLVALIGALTSVPLTLLLPALHHRKVMNLPLFCMGSLALRNHRSAWSDIPSLMLVYFSVVFLTCGVFGSVWSIQMDWANHGPPFACH